MGHEFNFGNITVAAVKGKGATDKFRIAVLGDFSARANSGQLQTGDALAARKMLRVDVDNFDDIIERLKIKLNLPIAADGGSVEVAIGSMDDFHPDQLYENVEIFSELSGLRQRLKNRSTFAAAAKELQAWHGETMDDAAFSIPKKSRGSAIPHGKISDFARLVGKSSAAGDEATPIDSLVKQIVGPHIVPSKDPQQDKLVAAVDEALSDLMRRILHNPDFQSLESLWRSVDLLVRRLESSSTMQIVLVDITAEELAADLSQAESLQQSGTYKLLVEQPSLDAQQGPFAVIASNFGFEQNPPHAELLGRIAKVAACAKAPFLASISNDVIKKLKPEEVHPLIKQSWDSLQALPEAAYVALSAPRFMLRWPYGEKTEPIDPFDFEEFTQRDGLRSMLWASGAFLAALLLGETFQRGGLKNMKLGSVMSVNEMPHYFYTDEDGDQIALPCTDRLLSEALAMHVSNQGFMPVLALKGRAEVRLGSFQSLAKKPLLGPWSSEHVTPTESPGPVAPKPAEPAAPAPAAPAPAASADAELDALLASLNAPAAPAAPAAENSVDADLAALLADL